MNRNTDTTVFLYFQHFDNPDLFYSLVGKYAWTFECKHVVCIFKKAMKCITPETTKPVVSSTQIELEGEKIIAWDSLRE